jgi:hypothetical protein
MFKLRCAIMWFVDIYAPPTLYLSFIQKKKNIVSITANGSYCSHAGPLVNVVNGYFSTIVNVVSMYVNELGWNLEEG